jgi:hypothetical protein
MPKADKPAIRAIVISPAVQRLRDKLLQAIESEGVYDSIEALIAVLGTVVMRRSKLPDEWASKQPSDLAREISEWFVETVSVNEDKRRH